LAPVGAVTTIVPVGVVQVGVTVILAVGVAGAPGGGNTVKDIALETHSVFVFFTITL